MKFRIIPFATAFSFLSVSLICADVLTMKNGEKIEGDILREEGENFVVEVEVTPNIRDEKIIPRIEVLKVEKTPEHEKVFKKIAELSPAPALLPTKGYDERIGMLKKYIEIFPDSPKVTKVQEMIKSLENELVLIKGGAIKFDEGMITAEQYEANAYEYDARVAEISIRDAVARRDYLMALRGFDSYEMSFGEADGNVGLATLMLQVLGAYRQSIAESLATYESRMATKQAGLARMTLSARAKSQLALDAEQSKLAQRLKEEKAEQIKWITPDSFYKESLVEAEKQASAEIARLDNLEAKVDQPLADFYRKTWEKLKEASEEERETMINDANERDLPEAYLEKLKERAEKLTEEEGFDINPFDDDAGAEEPEKADDK